MILIGLAKLLKCIIFIGDGVSRGFSATTKLLVWYTNWRVLRILHIRV